VVKIVPPVEQYLRVTRIRTGPVDSRRGGVNRAAAANGGWKRDLTGGNKPIRIGQRKRDEVLLGALRRGRGERGLGMDRECPAGRRGRAGAPSSIKENLRTDKR
jgi:hypothetical protein